MNTAKVSTADPRHWTDDYERLRRCKDRHVTARGGLAVLVHCGMAAWLAILDVVPAPPAPSHAAPHHAAPLPGDVETRLVDILVAITTAHLAGTES